MGVTWTREMEEGLWHFHGTAPSDPVPPPKEGDEPSEKKEDPPCTTN